MTALDYDKFTGEFQKLENDKKWDLSTGKIVEDELYKFGMKCRYEQYVLVVFKSDY